MRDHNDTLVALVILITGGLTCPTVPDNTVDTCVNECDNDEDCEGQQLCCSNGCGRVCSDSAEMCAVGMISTSVVSPGA